MQRRYREVEEGDDPASQEAVSCLRARRIDDDDAPRVALLVGDHVDRRVPGQPLPRDIDRRLLGERADPIGGPGLIQVARHRLRRRGRSGLLEFGQRVGAGDDPSGVVGHREMHAQVRRYPVGVEIARGHPHPGDRRELAGQPGGERLLARGEPAEREFGESLRGRHALAELFRQRLDQCGGQFSAHARDRPVEAGRSDVG